MALYMRPRLALQDSVNLGSRDPKLSHDLCDRPAVRPNRPHLSVIEFGHPVAASLGRRCDISAFRVHVSNIRFPCPDAQVRRVHARRIVAGVHNVEAVNGVLCDPMVEKVREPVRDHVPVPSPAPANNPITSACARGGPQPTVFCPRDSHLGPEPRFDRGSGHLVKRGVHVLASLFACAVHDAKPRFDISRTVAISPAASGHTAKSNKTLVAALT